MSIRKGRLIIFPGFFLFAATAFFLLPVEAVLVLYLSAAFHEFGHFIALQLCGISVDKITLSFSGAAILANSLSASCFFEFIIAAAGPIFSFAAACLSAFLSHFIAESFLELSAGINFVLGFFNLLPMHVLDGGKMLQSVLYLFTGPAWSDGISRVVNIAVTASLFAFGFYVFFAGKGNLSIIAISLCLAFCSCKCGSGSVEF